MNPRQLIVCCDGTNNNLTGGHSDTNVTKLCDLLAPEAQGQLLYYDAGVGHAATLPGATLGDTLSRRIAQWRGRVFGSGIYDNIAEAYLFLMRHYQPGDQIFLYGFSRGAFAARSVGGLVTQFGLLRPEMEGLVWTLLYTYFSDRQKGAAHYPHIRDQISELFAAETHRQTPVWFVGVWDTVASVGAPLVSRTITAAPTIVGKRFRHVRQALALDEHRPAFRPRLYYIDPDYDYAAHGQSIRQLWFSGAHSDVGGGYPTSASCLSNEALQWMLEESVGCGLRLPRALLRADGAVDPAAVLAAQRTTGVAPFLAVPLVHSQTYSNPWWALAGLQVRSTHEVAMPHGAALPAEPVEHGSVSSLDLNFPDHTVWRRARSGIPLAVAVGSLLLCWSVAGGLLAGAWSGNASLLDNVRRILDALPQAASANLALSAWQVGWPLAGLYPTASLPALHSIPAALLVDTGIITAYAYLIARGTGWAFASVAGIRRASAHSSRALGALGLSAPLVVGSDLAENLLTFLLVSLFPSSLLPAAELVAGLGMTLAAILKWTGLTGCIALVLWGTVAFAGNRRSQRRGRTPPSE